jgi:thymidylate synthase (FAD)
MSSVELLSYHGNDLMVVNAARVSYGKNKTEFDEKDAKLIKYLKEHKHVSVFRHPSIQFRITCPIFVERQLFKHQVGLTANSISGRYVDFSDSYSPVEDGQWRTQSKSSKQGSDGLVDEALQDKCARLQDNVIEVCKNAYNALINLGVAKEQARTILPLNLNTTFIWTGSLLAYLHFWGLRLKPDAQAETRQVAQQMLFEVRNIEGAPFKYSLEAFGL